MRFYADNRDDFGRNLRVEIIKKGSTESFQKLLGDSGNRFFDFSHETIDPKNPFENPIMKGNMEVHVRIEDSTKTPSPQQDFIDAILSSQEGTYQIIYKIDGDVVWTGDILPDLCQYDEVDPRSASLTAKDVTRLEGMDFTPQGLPSARQVIIQTLSDILGYLDYGHDIITATSWTEQNITESNDYLRQIFHDIDALRLYGEDDEDDEQITALSALEQILTDNCLFLYQWKGWRVQHISAFESPESVTEATYNSSGVFQSESSKDLRTQVTQIIEGSVNRRSDTIKSAEVTFNHRERVAQLLIPSFVAVDGQPKVFEESFFSTGDQKINLSCLVLGYSDSDVLSGQVRLRIRVGQYYWNGADWTTSEADVFTTLSGGGVPGVEIDEDEETNFVYSGSFTIQTKAVPGDALSPIKITFYESTINTVPVTTANLTEFQNIVYNIQGATDEEQSESINYRLTQAGDFSIRYTHPDTFYGDGPGAQASSALRYSDTSGDLTSNWKRRGQDTFSPYHENLLHEIMDLLRAPRRRLLANIYESWEPIGVIDYGGSLFYLGGRQDGYSGSWQVETVEANFSVEADDFDEFLRNLFRTQNASTRFVDDVRRWLIGADKDILRELSIGVTTADVDGEVTSLPVRLDTPIQVGFDYYVVDHENREVTAFTVTDPDWDGVDIDERKDTYGPGLLEGVNELPIESQIVDAVEGSFIIKQPGQRDTDSQFPDFSFVDDTLEVAQDTLKATMDLIAQGVNFAKANASAIDLVTGDILLSGATGDLDDIDDGESFRRVDSIAVTASGLVIMSVIEGDIDDVDDGTNFAKVKATSVSAGEILLAEAVGDIDDVDDGTNFAKVKATSVSAGEILLAEAVGDIDDLSDGTNFQRVAATQLTAGGIVLMAQVSGDLDDVDDGLNWGKVNVINIDATTGKIVLVEVIGDLDDVDDGNTFSKIRGTELSAGEINLSDQHGNTIISGGTIDTDEIFTNEINITDILRLGEDGEIIRAGDDFKLSNSIGMAFQVGTQAVRRISWFNGVFTDDANRQASINTTGGGALEFIVRRSGNLDVLLSLHDTIQLSGQDLRIGGLPASEQEVNRVYSIDFNDLQSSDKILCIGSI